MEQKFQTVYGVRLYPLEYLMNEELNDEDLSWLFDQKSLLYSIIMIISYYYIQFYIQLL